MCKKWTIFEYLTFFSFLDDFINFIFFKLNRLKLSYEKNKIMSRQKTKKEEIYSILHCKPVKYKIIGILVPVCKSIHSYLYFVEVYFQNHLIFPCKLIENSIWFSHIGLFFGLNFIHNIINLS